MVLLKIKKVKSTKKGNVISYAKVSGVTEKNLQSKVDGLKAEKKDFKIVENDVEKIYNFNGNNYVISTKKVK